MGLWFLTTMLPCNLFFFSENLATPVQYNETHPRILSWQNSKFSYFILLYCRYCTICAQNEITITAQLCRIKTKKKKKMREGKIFHLLGTECFCLSLGFFSVSGVISWRGDKNLPEQKGEKEGKKSGGRRRRI